MATGTCLCGAVTFIAQVEKTNGQRTFAACHCGMCRKWSGTPAMAVSCVGQPMFKGEEHIAIYGSSDWAERGFCKNCGTHLFYRLRDLSFYNIPLGLIDGSEKYAFDLQIYIDKKPDNYSFADKTKQMTEAEVIAKYSPV